MARGALFVAAVLTVACGADDGPTPDDAGPDAPAADAGATDAGGEDGGPAVDAGPACVSGPCDLVDQSGCAAGEACRFASVDDAPPGPVCAPVGDVAEGEPCDGPDRCELGTSCIAGFCRRLCCDGDVDCPVGYPCSVQLLGPGDVPTGVGLCALPPCDPLTQARCSPPNGCYVDQRGVTIRCVPGGTASRGAACASYEDCLPGLMCAAVGGRGPACLELCDDRTGAECEATEKCRSLPDFDTLGVCVAT
jgi:hypothetical protein